MFGYTERDVYIPFRNPTVFENETGTGQPGIAATLVTPTAESVNDAAGALPKNRQSRVVVFCHGLGGYRNYLYQKVLSRQLAQENGLYSLRFDFRGYGYSQDVDSPNGQTRYSEFADIQVVMKYAMQTLELFPCAVIAHSRAGAAMFDWVMLQQYRPDGIYVPNLINCAGRFHAESNVLESYKRRPDWLKRAPLSHPRRRHGKEVQVVRPIHEVISMSGYDLDQVKYLRPDTHVLTIQGDDDFIVPMEDAKAYDYLLNQVPGRHTFKILEGANHNFFLKDQNSPLYLTPEDGRPANAIQYMCNVMTEYLSVPAENARFAKRHELMPVTKVPRWKKIDGVINFRDYGGYPSALRSKSTGRGLWVRPNILFRSGNLDWCGPESTKKVADLGIKQIYDLRSITEVVPNKVTPDGFVHVAGAETTHNPLFGEEAYSPEALVKRAEEQSNLEQIYISILYEHSQNYLRMFHWLRDNEGDGMLVHCTAGKDRTGMFSALVLLLLGVNETTVAHEYELSTIGYAPDREKIINAVKSGKIRPLNPHHANMPVEAWQSMLASPFEVAIEVIRILNKRSGGVVPFLIQQVGLTHGDIDTIRSNLLYDGEPVKVSRATYGAEPSHFAPASRL